MSLSKKTPKSRLKKAQEKVEAHQLSDKETSQPSKAQAPREMKEWRSLIEDRIQKAMDKGYFDNLPGNGRPLDWQQNPHADPAEELANRILKDNNFAPEWIERDKEIREKIAEARERLQTAWDYYQPDADQKAGWHQAISRFAETIESINQKIDDFNLVVPILSKQRLRLRLAEEVQRVQKRASY